MMIPKKLSFIQCVLFLVLLSATLQVPVNSQRFEYFVFRLPTLPRCIRFPTPVPLRGDAELVDTDGSNGGTVTTGDFTISTSLLPVSGIPDQGEFLRIESLQVQAICLVTKDEIAMFNDPNVPTCDLEADLTFSFSETGNLDDPTAISRFSGRLLATGTGPDPFGIVGGTGGFVGVSGEILTSGSFQLIDSTTGNSEQELSFNAEFFICVYDAMEESNTT